MISLQPKDPRGYLGVARLYAAEGDTQRTIDTLVSGRGQITTVNLDLDYTLVGLLFDQGKTSDAKEIAAEFSKEVDRWLPVVTTVGRVKLENMNRLIQARQSIAENDLGKAQRALDAIIASVDKAGDASESIEALLAHDLLASILSQQRRPDLAAAHWAAIAERQPGFRQAAWKAGLADLELGRTDDAIGLIEDYLKLSDAAPEASMTLAQAYLQKQLSQPAADRNWSGFLSALQQAKSKLPNRWEWQLTEVAYLASQPTEEAKHQASERLQSLEAEFPEDVTLCERLVIVYQQLGRTADAERLLTRYDKLQPNLARRAMLRSSLLAGTDRVPEAIQLLKDAATKSSLSEQRDLALVRLKILLLTKQLPQAQELVSQLLENSPADPQLLMSGLEIALQRKDFVAAAKWAENLRDASSIDNYDWRYHRARLLIATYDKLDSKDRADLGQLVDSGCDPSGRHGRLSSRSLVNTRKH